LASLQATEQGNGGPEVRRQSAADAREALRRHADHSKRNAVHDDFAADDPRVSAELPPPRIVAQDQHRLAVRERRVLREERAAQRRGGAAHAKRVARHDIAEHGTALGACARALAREALRRDRQCPQILEHATPAAPRWERAWKRAARGTTSRARWRRRARRWRARRMTHPRESNRTAARPHTAASRRRAPRPRRSLWLTTRRIPRTSYE